MQQKEFYDVYHHEHAPHKVTEMAHTEKRLAISMLVNNLRDRDIKSLVVGCGLGEDIEAVGIQSVATDLSTVALVEARKVYPEHYYVPADAELLPFSDGQFDLIVCSEVIEHIPEPEKMLSEFHRILKKGGRVVITTPNWNSLYGIARYVGEIILKRPVTSADQPIDHWYTKNSLNAELHQYFKITEWRGAWFFPPIGLGNSTLPVTLMAALYKLLLPIEHWLQPRLPGLGHILVVSCHKR